MELHRRLTPIAVTPLIRPLRWSRLLWTYLIPLVPVITLFEGLVSCLRTYSVQELHDLAGFYKTPVGAKALQTMPKVMTEYFATMVPRMNDLQRDFQARMQAIMQKHGYPN